LKRGFSNHAARRVEVQNARRNWREQFR